MTTSPEPVADPLAPLRAMAAASLFPSEGTLTVTGLDAPVRVTRSAHGVPLIEATSQEDLWFAQGLVTAGERLFQIDLTLRAAAGRLSEAFGESTYEQDRFVRTIGLHETGGRLAAAWTHLDHAMHARFRAGVAAWVENAPALPLEYTLLGLEDGPDLPGEPGPWAACFAYLAWGLSNNHEAELLRWRIGERLGVEEARRLVPPIAVSSALGSNAWVIAGSRTASGAPMLANDSHLLAMQPSPWMPMHLRAPGYEAEGVAFTFSPGIVLGRTPHHAWGATNVTGDVQDLFLVTDADVTDTRVEPIVVRGEPEPRTHEVRITRHGPVLDRVPVGDLGDAWQDVEPTVAVRWTGREHSIRPSVATEAAAADSFATFRRAVLQVGCPGQNFVYADVEGHIGYQLTGVHPIRTYGDGTVPLPDHGWEGWVPPEELPWFEDPEDGVIVTANDAAHADRTPHRISEDFHAPHRAERIGELLDARTDHDLASFAAIQRDTVSLAARGVVPALLARTTSTAARRDALAVLATWDVDLAATSQAAAVYEAWIRAIARRALAERLGEDLFVAYTADIETWSCSVLPALLAELGDGIDDVLLGVALDDALAELGDPLPTWGERHRLTLAHPLARLPGLEGLFTAVEAPIGGDEGTIAQSGEDETDRGHAAVIASWRAVWDLAGPGSSTLPSGVSGNPASPHWNDQTIAYTTGAPEDEEPTGEVLTLEPG